MPATGIVPCVILQPLHDHAVVLDSGLSMCLKPPAYRQTLAARLHHVYWTILNKVPWLTLLSANNIRSKYGKAIQCKVLHYIA